MPRPAFPPTPAPSTDISGKPGTHATQLDSTFALPPAAIGPRGSSSSSATSNTSDSSYRPLSPTSPATSTKPATVSRKRPSTSQAVITKDDYSLPPPPTRSRKIIQMKPRTAEAPDTDKAQTTPATSKSTTPATGNGSKKKQSNSSTAAGRKIARKTAHSLIERRRRSKMNEEFGVLKDMIPACAGQEMHKLAILQASIDYMRYLEQCVADLKASHRPRRSSPTPALQRSPPTIQTNIHDNGDEDDNEDEEEDEDEDMTDVASPTHVIHSSALSSQNVPSASTSPAIYPADQNVHSTNPSPNVQPSDRRHYSITASPALHPSDPHHYSLASIRSAATSPSSQASPAFSAQSNPYSQFRNPFTNSISSRGSVTGAATFSLTSPALEAQPDKEDHEATEALLMLNTDRRSWSGRGMSVKDLLG